MLNIQERVPTTIQNPNPDEKILFNDATDGKLKTKDSSGVIEELSTDLVGVPTGGATGEVLAKASATDGDVEWVDPTGGVKEYVALLTQSGTDAPVATVIKNTLGGTVVWSYDDEGQYEGTLTGAFTLNKTYLSIAYLTGAEFNLTRTDSNRVFITTTSNSLLGNTSIKIEVYP